MSVFPPIGDYGFLSDCENSCLVAPDGSVYGVTFAAAVGVSDTGFVLTAAEVEADAHAGSTGTVRVSTEGCD